MGDQQPSIDVEFDPSAHANRNMQKQALLGCADSWMISFGGSGLMVGPKVGVYRLSFRGPDVLRVCGIIHALGVCDFRLHLYDGSNIPGAVLDGGA